MFSPYRGRNHTKKLKQLKPKTRLHKTAALAKPKSIYQHSISVCRKSRAA